MTNLAIVFMTGLTAGGLSCLAVQGGLLASSIASQAQKDLAETDKDQPGREKHAAQPIALFLGAKLIAYIVLGALLGLIGSALQLTPHLRAFVQIAIGLFMVGTALRLLNVHPIFRYFSIEPPKRITRYIRRTAKQGSDDTVTPIFLGAITVLIPCGVTVAMMALAIGSGSPVAGALILGAFVLGTTPVFFTLAYLATKLGERLQANFLKVAGAVVLILGLVSIDGGLVLAGSPITFAAFQQSLTQPTEPTTQPAASSAAPANGNTLTLSASNYAYSPRVIQAKAGQPYTLLITSEHNTGCGRSFVIPALNIQKTLPENGPTSIDIPAQPAGALKLTCIMGMYNATIQFNKE